ncbi:MAG: hypothetical protein DI543_12610 [Bradyrhizobium icense]|jgi:hypothetical protein|nr:MAG: hypothetical protein DI543_12610 [Bradyrhizobium icense]
MFREIEPLGGTSGAIGAAPALRHRDGGVGGTTNFAAPLRHPDGTINFDAYRERARRARTEAIRSSVAEAFSLIGKVFTV